MLEPQKTNTASEYLQLVAHYSYFVDQELRRWENDPDKRAHDVAHRLPRLISAVNVIGYFRGQDNMFYQYRPDITNDPAHPEAQSELYQNEDQFEGRLWGLIDFVLADPEAAATYREAMTVYYFHHRGLG